MRALWFKRPVLLLGGIGLFFCMATLLNRGQVMTVWTGGEEDSPRVSRSLSDLRESLNNLSELCQMIHLSSDGDLSEKTYSKDDAGM